jgi:hypothetical protein
MLGLIAAYAVGRHISRKRAEAEFEEYLEEEEEYYRQLEEAARQETQISVYYYPERGCWVTEDGTVVHFYGDLMYF